VSNVNLLLAAMDLKLVQMLRAAMNAGSAGGGVHATIHPAPRIEPRPVHHPDPRIEPRKVIEPAPRFEPRKVHRPEPRCEPPPCDSRPNTYTGRRAMGVLPPPWKMPLAATAPEPRPVIKRIVHKVDTVHKGSLIDFFM
jgi:hypothetical protein